MQEIFEYPIQAKFLESITFLGNDVLIPINRIKYINRKINDSGNSEIHIFSEDGDWIEFFEDDKCALERYEQIKFILNAK